MWQSLADIRMDMQLHTDTVFEITQQLVILSDVETECYSKVLWGLCKSEGTDRNNRYPAGNVSGPIVMSDFGIEMHLQYLRFAVAISGVIAAAVVLSMIAVGAGITTSRNRVLWV
ncbi:hypothetical protein M433DRAFT_156587 [Acidomyces richmondensis BFW]|jgi:hypothetical protein|nr:MAG: hypothetical protein FE78DRAFT_93376 [Acidomyces sp. 'richmondensis']KYG43546.1 hypothetical protein M433DRAFT_156587 [Acidomyces richmondensis BFW]